MIEILDNGPENYIAVCTVCGCRFKYDLEDTEETVVGHNARRLCCPRCHEWIPHVVPFTTRYDDVRWYNPDPYFGIPISPVDFRPHDYKLHYSTTGEPIPPTGVTTCGAYPKEALKSSWTDREATDGVEWADLNGVHER